MVNFSAIKLYFIPLFDNGIILSSGISGYVATNMYKKMGGENWVWNINLTSALFACKYNIIGVPPITHSTHMRNVKRQNTL